LVLVDQAVQVYNIYGKEAVGKEEVGKEEVGKEVAVSSVTL
jgi:hypothetical protein